MPNEHFEKYDPHHLSLGNCKLKQWDPATLLLEWLTYRNLTKSTAGEEAGQQNAHSLLVWIRNGTAMLEGSLSVFYKAEHRPTIQSCNLDPRYATYKQLCTNVGNSFIHNLQNWKQQRCLSIGQWYHGTLNNQLSFTSKKLPKQQKDMDEPQMHIGKWKKPVWKGYTGYDSNYMTFLKRRNPTDEEKISGRWESGMEVSR